MKQNIFKIAVYTTLGMYVFLLGEGPATKDYPVIISETFFADHSVNLLEITTLNPKENIIALNSYDYKYDYRVIVSCSLGDR